MVLYILIIQANHARYPRVCSLAPQTKYCSSRSKGKLSLRIDIQKRYWKIIIENFCQLFLLAWKHPLGQKHERENLRLWLRHSARARSTSERLVWHARLSSARNTHMLHVRQHARLRHGGRHVGLWCHSIHIVILQLFKLHFVSIFILKNFKFYPFFCCCCAWLKAKWFATVLASSSSNHVAHDNGRQLFVQIARMGWHIRVG